MTTHDDTAGAGQAGPGPTDADTGPWCVGNGTAYALDALRPQVVQLLQQATQSMTTGALALALGVPFWVADVLLDDMQQAGDVRHGPLGWRLELSATVALQLSLPASLRGGSPA